MELLLCRVFSATHFCIGKFIFSLREIKAFIHLQGKGGGNLSVCP